MRRATLTILLIMACVLTACSGPVAIPADTAGQFPVAQPIQANQPSQGTNPQTGNAYRNFSAFVSALPTGFHPSGFTLLNYNAGNAIYYGFDPELAWGKRKMTIVDGDDSKPSQAEYVFVSTRDRVAVVVEFMYVPIALEPDVIGFISVPAQEGTLVDGSLATLQPPQTFTEVFSYHNAVISLQSFPLVADPGSAPQDLINSHKRFSLALRTFLDSQMQSEGSGS